MSKVSVANVKLEFNIPDIDYAKWFSIAWLLSLLVGALIGVTYLFFSFVAARIIVGIIVFLAITGFSLNKLGLD